MLFYATSNTWGGRMDRQKKTKKKHPSLEMPCSFMNLKSNNQVATVARHAGLQNSFYSLQHSLCIIAVSKHTYENDIAVSECSCSLLGSFCFPSLGPERIIT